MLVLRYFTECCLRIFYLFWRLGARGNHKGFKCFFRKKFTKKEFLSWKTDFENTIYRLFILCPCAHSTRFCQKMYMYKSYEKHSQIQRLLYQWKISNITFLCSFFSLRFASEYFGEFQNLCFSTVNDISEWNNIAQTSLSLRVDSLRQHIRDSVPVCYEQRYMHSACMLSDCMLISSCCRSVASMKMCRSSTRMAAVVSSVP